MQRVVIIGSPGSGKSVFARRLGDATGLPVVHLDRHYWQEGWVEPTPDAWRARLAALVAAPRWIIDGNYAATLAERLARADGAILLDCPRWLCLVRVLRRAVRSFGRTRGEDMAPGCPERIDWPFLVYIWRYGRTYQPRVAQALAGFPGAVVVLRGRRAADRYLGCLETTA